MTPAAILEQHDRLKDQRVMICSPWPWDTARHPLPMNVTGVCVAVVQGAQGDPLAIVDFIYQGERELLDFPLHLIQPAS